VDNRAAVRSEGRPTGERLGTHVGAEQPGGGEVGRDARGPDDRAAARMEGWPGGEQSGTHVGTRQSSGGQGGGRECGARGRRPRHWSLGAAGGRRVVGAQVGRSGGGHMGRGGADLSRVRERRG
jgi:hypothetical protein